MELIVAKRGVLNLRPLALVLVVSSLVLASSGIISAAGPKVQAFDGDLNQVFDATVRAIERNWKKVQSSDRTAGTIRFHTGVSPSTWGGDCTASLRELGAGKVEVSLQSRNSAQLYAWGVGGRIAQKLFKSIQGELWPSASPGSKAPSTTSPAKK